MRFLIREQDFEQLAASGRFRYEEAGKPTGEYETWRLTLLADGHHFLRVDRDKQDTGENQGILYHMLLNPSGTPTRLKLRVLSINYPLQADILFEENLVTATGEFRGQRFESELDLSEKDHFYFSSAMGLALLLRNFPNSKDISTITFNLETTTMVREQSIRIERYSREDIDLGARQANTRLYSIQWPTQIVKLWLDEHELPLKIDFGNDQVAIDTHSIRYPSELHI